MKFHLWCTLKKVDGDSKKLNEHQPCAVGYKFICTYENSKSFYRDHVGIDSPAWFVKELKTLAEKVDEIFKNPKPMDPLMIEENFGISERTILSYL